MAWVEQRGQPWRGKYRDESGVKRSAGSSKNRKTAMTIADYREAYGHLVPLTPEELDELVVEVRCEVDGCDTVYSTELGNRWLQQALISHVWGRHAIKAAPSNAERTG